MRFLKSKIFWVLVAGLVVRLVAAPFGTLRLDQNTFIAWSKILVKGGFANFYSGWSDYLPGYLYFLWVLGKVRGMLPIPDDLLYKIPAIVFDIATGGLIYEIVRRIKSAKAGVFAASLYVFNPAILANSAFWGQVDSLTAFFIVLSLYLLPARYYLSAVFLAIGTLIKPQAAFIFPVILFLMLRERWKFEKIFAYLFIGIAVFIGLFLPFWNHGNLISFIIERLSVSLNQYPYTSINAFNFWGITGFWKPDSLYTQIAGYAIVAALFIFLVRKLWKKEKDGYLLAAFILSSSFIFFTRMHERHLLPALAPLAIAVSENFLLVIPYIGFSVIYVLNLLYSYNYVTHTQNFVSIYPQLAIKLMILVNIMSLSALVYTVLDPIKVKKFVDSVIKFFEKVRRRVKNNGLTEIKISGRESKIILGVILAFALFTRVFDLGSPPKEYFDEVYHAFTAKVILSPVEVHKAWEWWNTPPAGFAYEWTHPPLAKLGMVFGMSIFGQNSFGWRIPGALLGVGSVFLVYLLAKKIFGDEVIALLSAGVFSLDGLALVMSRIGMNDSYILFFTLLSIYLFLRQKDLASAISFGLAISSKWSAIWAVPILGIIWLWRLPAGRQGKRVFTPILWFFILPPLIYLGSYFQMFLTGHDLSTWWGMQQQMWWYHTGLRATHPYSSPWWEWPLLIRPIYLYTSEEISGMVSRIYAFGNPLVFWFGVISIIASLIYSYFEKNKSLGLVVFSYLIFFVPWAVSPRIMFLYHYLPSIPFMSIATGYVLRRNPKLILGYLVIGLLLFIYFYPHWAGLRIPLWLDRSYYWMASWR